MTTAKATPKKSAPKKTATKSAPKKTATKSAPKKTATKSAEPKPKKEKSTGFDLYKGAMISEHVPQPAKHTLLYVDVDGEDGTETHLIDLTQMPEDIIASFKGEMPE
jgi:hypothetical protein